MSRRSPGINRLAADLRARRQQLGWTQKDLANMTGIHERSIRNIENGQRGTTHHTAQLLAQAMNRDVGLVEHTHG